MNWYHGQGAMLGSWLILVLILVLVILAILYIAKLMFSKPRPGDNALEVLRQRYAAGEISKEEYDRIKKDLS